MAINASIKKLINEEKKNISDEELFGSSKYKDYLQKICNSILMQNKLKPNITVLTTLGDTDSFTDNKIISINVENEISMSLPKRSLRSESIIGVLGHELGHVLYTNFNELNTYFDNLSKGEIYPSINKFDDEELQNNLNEINNLLEDNNNACIKVLSKIGGRINNILEDLYVNTLICKNYPGSFKKGILLFYLRMYENFPSIQSQIDDGYNEISIITNILISYIILGKINNLGNYEGEYLDFLDECIPVIDSYVMDSNATSRLIATNEILVRAWKWIKPLLDNNNDDETVENIIYELEKEIEKISFEPSGKGNGKATKKMTSLTDEDKINSDDLEELRSYVYELTKTDEIVSEGSGLLTNSNGYDNSYSDLEKNLEKILDELAFNSVSKNEEMKLSSELQACSDQIRYGNAHNNIDININRKVDISVRMKEDYNKLSKVLLPISKRLQQQIKPILAENKNTKYLRNQISGKRVDMRNVAHEDNRCFSTKLIPNCSDLVVGILIDESGSMSAAYTSSSKSERPVSAAYTSSSQSELHVGAYRRIDVSMATAILLEDFCRNLSIPITIYGHTSIGKEVELFSYAEFDSIDRNDKYRLMDIRARSENRDGCAIRFVCERLLTRNEEIKLMIIISDGQPSAYGYSGTEAEADIRGIKREYENKGISMFSAAIGDDRNNIQRIYKNGYLDISNLEELPKRLAALITKHIKTN